MSLQGVDSCDLPKSSQIHSVILSNTAITSVKVTVLLEIIVLILVYQTQWLIIHTGDTGLKGPNGETGIPGTSDVLLLVVFYRTSWYKRREG